MLTALESKSPLTEPGQELPRIPQPWEGLATKSTHPARPPPSNTMAEPASPTSLLVLPPNEPPPPYSTSPHRSRRNRRPGARVPADSVVDCEVPTRTHPPQRTRQVSIAPDVSDEETATEASPLLSTPLLRRRQRTLSQSSTVRSNISGSPSFAQTLISAFQPELDSDIDLNVASLTQDERRHICRRREISETSADGPDQHLELLGPWARIKRYFRPMSRKAYYSAVFHLLVVNFPFALLAWVYLFVFTLVCSGFYAFQFSALNSFPIDWDDATRNITVGSIVMFPRFARGESVFQSRGGSLMPYLC